MNIRTYTEQERICALSRRKLPSEVNDRMSIWNHIAYKCNAKVTFIPGVEQPIGPFGNWIQTITITVEGDYDDPKCKELFDIIYTHNSDRLKELYDGDFSIPTNNDSCEISGNTSKVDTANQTLMQRRTIAVTNSNTDALLKRAFFFLEDGDWKSADEYCETVLDIDPECAEAYLGKMMAELQVCKQEELKNCAEPFSGANYQKILRFGDDALRKKLAEDIAFINERNENARREEIYKGACEALLSASSEHAYYSLKIQFQSISGYKDSSEKANHCQQKITEITNNGIYDNGISLMSSQTVEGHLQALELFEKIPGWKDSDELIEMCKRQIPQLKILEEEKERTAKKIKIIVSIIAGIALIIAILWYTVIVPSMQYRINKIKSARVGDTVFFGTYEQDNNTTNGKEDIEWLVLGITDNKALLISKYALDCKKYNSFASAVTWETCSLRKWLNDDFINDAFSTDEKSVIATATYSTNPIDTMQDRVFLLGFAEANIYLSSSEVRKCSPTDYAVANGVRVIDGTCWWWLRSPGSSHNEAIIVSYRGTVDESGYPVSAANNAVRPALWIDLGASN